MMGMSEKIDYSPLPSNPNSPNYPYPPSQNVVVLLPSYHRHRDHRNRNFCFLYSIIALLILAAATFFLYPSDPEIHLARIRINRVAIRTKPKPFLDISFSITVQARNRDFFSVSYDSLAVSVGYRNRDIGFVSSGGGEIMARGSSYVDATLIVDGFEVIYDAFYLIEDLAKGVIPFDTNTRFEGNLGLFFFNVPLKATVSCEVYVNINNQTIAHQDCYPESLSDTLDQSA
ncbi:hypothetical protein Lal_00002814 [Lupinus albus]|uniref:Putative Late embryogenesis abundant protein, LEA-14 n=1 Tax=Lupinus albus TaxID=3870 RepID=A0A6A5N5R2_LUPAL|nr:putative Late embryogenesis abundant protein, LEA-14 [Lupinus albus]KAF1882634.1 hypothetical protein Lal_00002814 [Lupinus albus]